MLKEFHFTDEQIDFLLDIVKNNAQYEDDHLREWMTELANQIEDQIVNHPTNDWRLMRIALTVMFIMLGANLFLSVIDSNMLEMIEQRNQQIEALTNTNWVGCPTNWATVHPLTVS